MQWAIMISEYIVEDKPIVYMDETTFQSEMHQSKVWYSR